MNNSTKDLNNEQTTKDFSSFFEELESDAVEPEESEDLIQPRLASEDTNANIFPLRSKREVVIEDPADIFNTNMDDVEAYEKKTEALKKSSEAIKYINRITDRIHFNACLELMQRKYSVINRQGSTYILSMESRNEIYSDVSSFHLIFKHLFIDEHVPNSSKIKRTQLTDAFICSPDTARLFDVVLDPTSAPGADDVTKTFNKWRGWKYTAKKGDVSMFKKLLLVNAGNNQESYEYMTKYLAHMIQKPGQLPRAAICITGPQGTGKGTLVLDTLCALTDSSHKAPTMSSLCTGQFNAEQAHSILFAGDEITFSGNVQDAEALKNFITETNRSINEKNRGSYIVKAYTRLFLMSNNANVTKIEKDDRRFCVSNIADDLANNEEWFTSYHAWLKNGGFEAIMHYLMHEVDISNFNTAKIPDSKAKTDLKMISLPTAHKFIFSMLEGEIEDENIFKTGRVDKKKFFDMFNNYCKAFSLKYFTTNEFSRALNEIFRFEEKNKNWNRNWKNSDGSYYYLIGSVNDAKKSFAENYMKQKPELIFSEYEEPKDKMAVADSEVAEAFN